MAGHDLTPDVLRRRSPDASLDFETTDDLEDLQGTVGQSRAVEALEVGLDIRRDGYNIFILGVPGAGKHTVARQALNARVAHEERPSDLCYVMNFGEPHRPRALRPKPGQGACLKKDLDALTRELKALLPVVFTSDRYASRSRSITEAMEKVQTQAVEALQEIAVTRGLLLERTDEGFHFAVMHPDGDKALSDEEFDELPEETRELAETALDEMEGQLHALLGGVPRWRKETRDRLRSLEQSVTREEVERLMGPLRARYAASADVIDYLEAVARDMVEQVSLFKEHDDDAEHHSGSQLDPQMRRYAVNVLVDHAQTVGAPLVYEDNPAYANLIGRIEHISEFGALTTDHTLIKAGALHAASGGYLLLDARRLMTTPFSWDALKRTLRSGLLRLDAPQQQASLLSTVTLMPEPIAVDVKVLLMGEPDVYYHLCEEDPEFERYFKILAAFEERIPRTVANEMALARLIATKVRQESLLPFHREAVAQIMEHSARQAEDAEHLSANLSDLFNILDEADYWARRDKREVVLDEDVDQALATYDRRSGGPRDNVLEAISRGTLRIATTGGAVGQVNGLAVMALGRFEFGKPNRISATARMGRGELVDIERESHLGGRLHRKGMLILSALLRSRVATDVPLSLAATVVFEQSYTAIDGDSASMAEFCALLSAIAEVPIQQGRAITGSVDQHGSAQAIGGVNAKIEGFFDVCVRAPAGLTRNQGVIIPATNIKNLMLRRDVVQAVRDGDFHVWAVETVEEAVELLMVMPAGARDAAGNYPPDSVFGRVEARLVRFWNRRREVGDVLGTAPSDQSR